MKRDNDFFYFLSFLTFYTVLLLWYTHYTANYEEMIVPTYTTRGIGEYTYVAFFFKVILAFPFGILNWFKEDPLNIVFYFFGAMFYSFLFYRIYYKDISRLLWVMLVLNILAAIFLLSFYIENPLTIDYIDIGQ